MSWTAYECIGDPKHAGPLVFTCEHATNLVPPPLVASADDQPVLAEHWGWDIGARDVTHTLVDQLGGQAVLSRFSRLVIDPNRGPREPSTIVREIDGYAISFNRQLDEAEHGRRIRELYEPYHHAIDAAVASRLALGPPFTLLAIHSFTPLYLGRPRPMEIGVLFDEFDDRAAALAERLTAQGFEVALNAPYSGKPPQGLIYSAQVHGRAHGVEYLELEIRQDLIDAPERARAVAKRIAAALSSRA